MEVLDRYLVPGTGYRHLILSVDFDFRPARCPPNFARSGGWLCRELRNQLALRVTSGRRGTDAGSVLAFGLGQLISQALGFGAILFSFDTKLDGPHAADRIHDLGDAIALALAEMFELVGEIVLVQGISLGLVDTTVKIPNFRPTLGFRDHSIADRDGGVLPLPSVLEIVGENLEIVFPPGRFPGRRPNRSRSRPWHCRS